VVHPQSWQRLIARAELETAEKALAIAYLSTNEMQIDFGLSEQDLNRAIDASRSAGIDFRKQLSSQGTPDFRLDIETGTLSS
jgi:hypothetical protein